MLSRIPNKRTALCAAVMLVAVFCLSIWQLHRANYNNLLCVPDCGEVFISELQLRHFDMYGLKYGFLEDQATSADPAEHPYLYTHNINLGSFMALALKLLGLETLKQRQLGVLFVFALSLWLTFAAVAKLTRSPACGLTVALFIATHVFISNYALHGLRVFHLLAFALGLLFFSSVFRSNIGYARLIAVACLSAIVSAGIGYEFWIVSSASIALAVVLLALISRLFENPIPPRRVVASLAIYGAANVAVFTARQAQVIWVLGWEYWAKDLYYSLVIKVPGATRLFGSVDQAAVDAFYAKWHVLRPPASAIDASNVGQFLELLKTHFLHSALPKLGSFHLLLLAGLLVWGIAFVVRRIVLVATSTAPRKPLPQEMPPFVALLALTLGYVLGCVAFLQLWIDHYTAHLDPFLVVPVTMAAGFAFFMACREALRLLRSHRQVQAAAFAFAAVVILASHVVVQRENLAAGVAAPFSWIDEVRRRADHSFAISFTGAAASAFTRNYVLELAGPYATRSLERMARGAAPFTEDMISQFGERRSRSEFLHPDYWLYFNSDRRTDSWARRPICRHDWLARLLLPLVTREGIEIALPGGVKARPGGTFVIEGKIADPLRQVTDVEVSVDRIRADTLYNCVFGTVAAIVKLPPDLPPGQYRADVKLLSATGAVERTIKIPIDVSPEAPVSDPDAILSGGPMLPVEQVVARYPNLPIAARGDDYLLIDLKAQRSRESQP